MKRNAVFTVILLFSVFASMANPFNSKLSGEELSKLNNGEVLIRNIGSMKEISVEQFGKMINDAVNYYFRTKNLEDIEIVVTDEEMGWLQQQGSKEILLSFIADRINKLHYEGGLLNEIVLEGIECIGNTVHIKFHYM